MIDGTDYFPKRDKQKKGIDSEWDDLKKIKLSQKTKENIASGTESKSEKKDNDAPK